jgi:diguanylate cyclase (GGDEF)-like protein
MVYARAYGLNSPLWQAGVSTGFFITVNPGDPNPTRLSSEDAFLEMLTDTLETLERPARGQFLQRFFKSIAHVDLNETQSLEYWEKAIARKRELSESVGRKVALQAALVDVLASADLLRLPILMEYEELRKLQINAATDPLTGLYNRRFFDDYFEKELNRSARYSHKLALVVFDLHRFKQVNDRHGHPQGDVLLQMVATTLRNSMRTSDYAFRIGGDEFALLLPQSDTEQATTLSKRLRAAYASATEPLRLGIPLELDYGLAVYPDDADQQQMLIRIADERLYQLKNATTLPLRAAESTETQDDKPEKKEALPSAWSHSETPPIQPAGDQGERRRWERVSLTGTRAYAIIGEGASGKARVMNLGYGGVAIETSHPEEYSDAFYAVLHVPILPPVRVNLRRVYQLQATANTSRVGCVFVT